ncbi:MAG: hypothetical protein ACOCUH_04570, partial [Bacteriovoracia bacterium]
MKSNGSNNNYNNNHKNKNRDENNDPIAPNMEKRKAKEKAIQEEIEKQSQKFKDGQMLKFVRVRFPGNARSFPFLMGNRELGHGEKVVAMSDRG